MIRLVCIGCKWMYCTFISNHANPWLSYCIKLVQIIYRYICLLVNASAFWTNRYELAKISMLFAMNLDMWLCTWLAWLTGQGKIHTVPVCDWDGQDTWYFNLWLIFLLSFCLPFSKLPKIDAYRSMPIHISLQNVAWKEPKKKCE